MVLKENLSFQQALLLANQGRFDESKKILTKLSVNFSCDPVYNFYFGLTELNLGQHEQAINYLNKSIHQDPKNIFAIQALGKAFSSLGKHLEALSAFDQVNLLNPKYPDAFNDKGVELSKIGKFKESISCFESAINLDTMYADAYLNYGLALYFIRRYKQAVVSFDNVIKLDPHSSDSLFYRGQALKELCFYELAIKSFDSALASSEDHKFLAKVNISRALLLVDLGRFEEALAGYEQAQKMNADEQLTEFYLLISKMHLCNWHDFYNYRVAIFKIESIDSYLISPLNICYVYDDLSLLKKTAEQFSLRAFGFNNVIVKNLYRNKKIRIGYFSADFHQHPVSHLTAEIFELHNRDRFEVIAFSLSPKTDSMRDRLENAFDQFLDMEGKDDQEIVDIARNMEIDIAVDLGGFTKNARTGIFALRAAPVQVNYLGYPGTMGSSFMDYIIADSVVIPSELKSFYSESVAYLPNSFMPSDSKTMPANIEISRQDAGLPESKFVFCCFLPAIKLTPDVFSSWMRILTAVKDSVLWLSSLNIKAMENLKAAAESMGVDCERIIFAAREDLMEDHLNRLRMADLFLDTYPYNAHTTANDALKVGLPLVTIMGQSFASRVASSLLSAVNLQELIVNNIHDYESLAVSLANDPVKLKQIRQKLMDNIKTSTLFDTKVFTNNIELLYEEMYRRYQNELPVDDIFIA